MKPFASAGWAAVIFCQEYKSPQESAPEEWSASVCICYDEALKKNPVVEPCKYTRTETGAGVTGNI